MSNAQKGKGFTAMPSKFLIQVTIVALTGFLTSCASTKQAGDRPDRNFNAPTLTVSASSLPKEVLAATPTESLMERLRAKDTRGRIIDYIAFTDTEAGGVIFVDGKFTGIISRHDTQAFYICRGYTLGTPNHYWADDTAAWVGSLLERMHPETSVLLEFTGKTTIQTIKTATENPLLGRIKTILGMGSNPLGVFSTLNSARNDYEASEQFEKESEAMERLNPGAAEAALAKIAPPNILAFTDKGMLMVYPTHRIEYHTIEGVIQSMQQPAFYLLARTQSGVFYAPGIQWKSCTVKDWPTALPSTPPAAPAQTNDQTPPPVPSPVP